MFLVHHHKNTNRASWPGSVFCRSERVNICRRVTRRWRRAMILPETVFIAAMILSVAWFSDRGSSAFRAGQSALAAGGASVGVSVIEDGVSSTGTDSRKKQRNLQQKLRRDPDGLFTLTMGDVVHAFNYADLQRHEGNVIVLQFRGNDCILDVYIDTVSAQPKHFEFRARGVAGGTQAIPAQNVRNRDCVDDILKSRRT